MNTLIEFLSPLTRDRAYLDPGSGSILLQMVIAAALGAAFAVKVYWKKIKGTLSKKKNGDVSGVDKSDSPNDDAES